MGECQQNKAVLANPCRMWGGTVAGKCPVEISSRREPHVAEESRQSKENQQIGTDAVTPSVVAV